MTRRRFFAPPTAFSPGDQTVILSAEEARHARDVLRLRAGDEIYVFDGAGKEFRCVVREFVRHGATLDLKEDSSRSARIAGGESLSKPLSNAGGRAFLKLQRLFLCIHSSRSRLKRTLVQWCDFFLPSVRENH